MRYISIDYGSKRVGVAISDEGGTFAFPHALITNEGDEHVIQALIKIIEKEKAEKIIVGLPISFEGRKTPQALQIEMFAEALSRAVQLPIDFQNEVLTSRMGEKAGIDKKNLDAASAAIILQSYLDKSCNHSHN
jgi:putative Holliday junction resolvase